MQHKRHAVNGFDPAVIRWQQCPQVLYFQKRLLDAAHIWRFISSLWIEEAVPGTITNLNGLSELTSVEGSLDITNNASLTNVDGLAALSEIGWWIDIINNDASTNVDGLASVTSVDMGVNIVSNDALTNVDGLAGLNYVHQYYSESFSRQALWIEGNERLADCCGLHPLFAWGTVEGVFDIDNNDFG